MGNQVSSKFLTRLWDVVDISILIAPILAAAWFCWHIHDIGWMCFFALFGVSLAISEVVEKVLTGKTMTQMEHGYWKVDRTKALAIWGLIALFFVYLEFMHLMPWNH